MIGDSYIFESASASMVDPIESMLSIINEKIFIHKLFRIKTTAFSFIDRLIDSTVRILCIYTIHMSCGVKLKKTITTIVSNSMLWAIIIILSF